MLQVLRLTHHDGFNQTLLEDPEKNITRKLLSRYMLRIKGFSVDTKKGGKLTFRKRE